MTSRMSVVLQKRKTHSDIDESVEQEHNFVSQQHRGMETDVRVEEKLLSRLKKVEERA